ncbi:TlpA family protein disulfide reductase [Nubsella zeaxanthinifaciens]|jgi:thiol-disulfide isomerase/thioredoxin|uniref:TlpA family protein disulfide reductase n=1 Tax=Nubsella zeaxanthinifaciens TaxID=392412 RepID=UPI000DE4E901|nr:thioredoxin family protein [Nubsella zeaxanthinifaciens]
MKYLFTILFAVIYVSANAQQINKKLEDQIKHKEIMLNECSREGLVEFPEFKASYDANYENYKVDSANIAGIKKLMKDKKIKVVLGTWCGDSKYQVPNFLKIMDAAKIDQEKVSFIAVDGAKKAENGLLDGLDIQRVPTFIVTDKKGKEIGRIVEHPKKSLELDLVDILTVKK